MSLEEAFDIQSVNRRSATPSEVVAQWCGMRCRAQAEIDAPPKTSQLEREFAQRV
jgi:hypothetical protein